ncbi:MAG TPA: biotin carboxylase N-terminal domain-containing protein [Candidatus Limnocylindria bacterium]|nr:biotin carboxylase N-terminal domain-containing protein [Candidatus Limnocylindria bacterium]
MTTLLVANRGEIARRIVRTARRMGLRTVAAHSSADATLPFVREADAAVPLGPADARSSYLDVDRIVAAAREAGADLVHPGYGFLSEQPSLARALATAGIRLVGPPADVLEALGDKARAKDIAERAGVPTVPGYRGDDQRDATFAREADRIGYPVLVKPVGGGGGIAMHAVRDASALEETLARARRGAKAAFGDERLLLERLLERPRHVEVQILADTHGSVTTFAERDCSAQRRHQKVVEESPSPAVDARTRARLRSAALGIARASRYVNAGTVEFVLDGTGAFFFLEVNARLQVEHPVTEAVYGIDLVEQQLRVALGEHVSLDAGDPGGHAVEARVYAEDPAAGFLPSTGTLLAVRWPDAVRVDAGFETGDEVTRHYDPLLAKVVAHADTRDAALAALDRGLAETAVLGVRTNVAFLRRLLAHPAMRAGTVDTTLIDRDIASLAAADDDGDAAVAVAAAVLAARARRDPRDPWGALGPWRLGAPAVATVMVGDRAVGVEGAAPARALGHEIASDDGAWLVDGAPAVVADGGAAVWVHHGGRTSEVPVRPRRRDVDALTHAEVLAPMPGVVLSVHSRGGQRVRKGELLCVVEAMKMELRVESPGDGTIAAVLCAPGQQVERGQRLAEFEPDASS